MYLTRQVRIQLVVFAVLAVFIAAVLLFGYLQVPARILGIGRYTVTVQLQQTGGLYEGGNVAYRGVDVGRVAAVRLTHTGAEAVLRLKSDIRIPSDLRVEVHSMTAIGEQYVELLPQSANGRPLKGGDVIPAQATYVPPDLNSLLTATNRGLMPSRRATSKQWSMKGISPSVGLAPSCPGW